MGQGNGDSKGHGGHHGRFDQELPRQLAAPGAHGKPQADFPHPPRGQGGPQIGVVEAGYEQDQARHRRQDDHLADVSTSGDAQVLSRVQVDPVECLQLPATAIISAEVLSPKLVEHRAQ